jgi:hypothetical protein
MHFILNFNAKILLLNVLCAKIFAARSYRVCAMYIMLGVSYCKSSGIICISFFPL